MELRHYAAILWRWWWLIVLSVAVAGASSYVASGMLTPLYQTKSTLMVGRSLKNPAPNTNELYTGQQLAYTYIQLARREPVLDGTVTSLGLPYSWQTLAQQVSASIVPQTQLIEIVVTDSDPLRAKAIADEIARQLILQSPSGNASGEHQDFTRAQIADLAEKISKAQDETKVLTQELDAATGTRRIQELQGQINVLESKITTWQDTYSKLLASVEGGDVNALTLVEAASVPGEPVSPNKKMNFLLAVAAGAILSIAGIFLVEYLDDTLKTPADTERATGLTVLGNIGRIERKEKNLLVSLHEPLSPVAEDIRVLRMNLEFCSIDRQPKTILFTSPNSMEGKSLLVSNLAVCLADAGQRVILIDGDLRRPVLHQIFHIPNLVGITNAVVYHDTRLEDCLQESGIANLRILSSGPLPPNPVRLLESEKFTEIVNALKDEADIVLFDSPPLLMFSDPTILSTRVEGVVLVTRAGFTRSEDARRAVSELRKVCNNLLGCVLNRQKNGHRRGYSYHYQPAPPAAPSRTPIRALRERLKDPTLKVNDSKLPAP